MTEKIKVVAYSRHREKVFSDHINKMPIHITHELNGEYEEVDCRFSVFYGASYVMLRILMCWFWTA